MTTKKPEAPATFRYVAFLDLIVDAAFQHRLATQTEDSLAMSRHARSSVAAAFLTIECIANVLLEEVDVAAALRKDLDKLAPLSKIEVALQMLGKPGYDRGRHEVQKAVEVIQARNDYVHSKAVKINAKVHPPEDAGADWLIPFVIMPEFWKGLGIPKQSMFWSADVSRGVLQVVRDYLKYVLADILKADEDLMTNMLPSHLVVGNLIMPGVYDEFRCEIAWLMTQKLDFSFLTIAGIDWSAYIEGAEAKRSEGDG